MSALVARDYRGALDVLRVAHESEDVAPFSTRALEALRRLIPCSIVTYREWNEETGSYAHWASGIDVDEVERIWDRYPAVRSQDPLPGVCPGAAVRVAPGVSLQLSDFMSLSDFRRLDLYHDVCRPVGTNYVMKLFLSLRGYSAGFVFESERHDFTRRDRSVLDLLAPHFVLLRRLRSTVDRAVEPETLGLLTPREREVLGLVAHGMTNREIAQALFVAPGTVRKHLDNVYRKLGVRGRAEAVSVTRR